MKKISKPVIKKRVPKKAAKKKNYRPRGLRGAPKGNQFWKLCSKHGRDKLFATPELMWTAACEYFEWCENNPLPEDNIEILKVNGIGDLIKRAPLNKMRAFTIQGLCLYLNCNTKYFNDFQDTIKDKSDETSKGFSEIITRIREIIYTQKFTGAAAGFLNPNIIARDLGLIDKTEAKNTNTNLNYNSKELTEDEIKKIGKALEDEF